MFTLGYQFTTSVPFTVDALAYFDDGLGQNHQVGIWNSGGTLLVSTIVLGTDFLQGHFRYDSITPYNLSAGAYTIGGEYFGIVPPPHMASFPIMPVGVVTVPGYTWTQAVFASGAGLNDPTSPCCSGFGQNAILIPNFSIVPAVGVPESSTLILLAAGLAGILGYGWRRKRAT